MESSSSFLHALAQIDTVPGRHPGAPHRGGGLPSSKPGLCLLLSVNDLELVTCANLNPPPRTFTKLLSEDHRTDLGVEFGAHSGK